MVTIQLVPCTDSAILVPLLHDAEEGDDRIVQAIDDASCTAYLARSGEQDVGAVLIRWEQEDCEIVYIATVPALRGQGYGKAMISGVIEEVKARGMKAVHVGTANTSWENIAFYQKCGFRMDSVRKDYFDYFPEPIFEDGIQMRDMLMLRLQLSDI